MLELEGDDNLLLHLDSIVTLTRDHSHRIDLLAAGVLGKLKALLSRLVDDCRADEGFAEWSPLQKSLAAIRNLCASRQDEDAILDPEFVTLLKKLLTRLWPRCVPVTYSISYFLSFLCHLQLQPPGRRRSCPPSPPTLPLVFLLRRDSLPEATRCIQTCLQLLANGAAQNSTAQSVVWEQLFPDTFLALVGRRSDVTLGLACAVVHQCTVASVPRCEHLSSQEGALLIGEVVTRLFQCADDNAQDIEWAAILLASLVAKGVLDTMLTALRALPNSGTDVGSALLCVVADDVVAAQSTLVPGVSLRQLASRLADFQHHVWAGQAFWTGDDASERRQCAAWLRFWCTVTSTGDAYDREAALVVSQAAGALLQRAVEAWPVPKPRPGQQHDTVSEFQAHTKADLVRLLGNTAYQNQAAQDSIRDSGGLAALLNCCQLDERNPIIKEWYAPTCPSFSMLCLRQH